MSLLRWLEEARDPLAATAQRKGWQALRERDLQEAMEVAGRGRPRSIDLVHWPNVGQLDLAVGSELAVELKWANSGDGLCNCAWDIAKLASVLVELEVEEAWIAAGAPVSHWESGAPGIELFTPKRFEDDEIVRSYESWWRFWCRDVLTRPTHLPRAFAVTDAFAVPCVLHREPFELRAARVEVLDARWRAHECPHKWRGEACRPRPWDAEVQAPG